MNTTRNSFGALALAIVLTAGPGCAEATPAPPEGFYLEILYPTEHILVTNPWVVVKGRTSPDAVVSVQGQVLDVSAEGYVVDVGLDGTFEEGVRPKHEGSNVIEIVARNPDGEERTATLEITFVSTWPRCVGC